MSVNIPQEPTISAARLSDAAPITEILQGFARQTPWMPVSRSDTETRAAAELMIERGWVRVIKGEDARLEAFLAREEAYIHALYVRGDKRGLSLGKSLLDDAKAATTQLSLWVAVANARARAFYRREGFTPHEGADGQCNDEHLPEIRHVWHRAGGPI